MEPAGTVNLIDPTLIDGRGHHAPWVAAIARALSADGWRVRVACHRDLNEATAATLTPHAQVLRAFTVDPYDGMRRRTGAPDPQQWYPTALGQLAAQMRGLPPADIDAFPTLMPVMLHAWAMAGRATRFSGVVHHDVRLTYALLPARWQDAVRAAEGADLGLGATTLEVRAMCLKVFEGLLARVPVLPICVDGVRSPWPRRELRRVGFFGRQDTRAKGVRDLFEPLARGLIERGCEVVLQDSSGRTPQGWDFPVTRLGFVDDFALALSSCDLVIAPYDSQYYRVMASGVVWEAVACGVPVIAPAGTAAGRFVRETGAGTTFDADNAQSILASFDAVRAGYGDFARTAHHNSVHWLETNGTRRYARALVSRWNSRVLAPAPAPGTAHARAKLKVAVITPCHHEPDAWLKRCIDSVAGQTHACTHIIVGDGVHRSIATNENLLHVSLPTGVADYGDTPRCVGSIYAAGLGFDAIAYLDADNWYHPTHIESMVTLAAQTSAAVVTSRRTLHHLETLAAMAECLMSDGDSFCDTNCLMVLRAAFPLLAQWTLMDSRMHAIDDRVIWHHLVKSGLPRAHTGRATVAYLATHARIYQDLGLVVPREAKEPEAVRDALAAWANTGAPSLALRARYRRLDPARTST